MKKLICSMFILAGAPRAFAFDMGYESHDALEVAQISILRQNLKEQLGMDAKIRFTSEFMSPKASYNRVTGVAQALLNLRRAEKDKVYGATVREVVVEYGPLAYRCQAAASFVGGVGPEHLRYAALNACSIHFVEEIEDMDTQCFKTLRKGSWAACPPIDLRLPSAVRFEVRR